jgi:hypothetical protein
VVSFKLQPFYPWFPLDKMQCGSGGEEKNPVFAGKK